MHEGHPRDFELSRDQRRDEVPHLRDDDVRSLIGGQRAQLVACQVSARGREQGDGRFEQALLRTLINEGATAGDIPQIIAAITSIDDPEELVRYLVHTTRVKFGQWSGLMRQVTAAAAQEPAVRESLEIAHGRLRDGLALGARQLAQMGALRERMDAARATDVLWFYLCNAAYFIRSDDLGWPLEESEDWLTEALLFALLGRTPA